MFPNFPFPKSSFTFPTDLGATQGILKLIASPKTFGVPSNFDVKQNKSIFL